MSQKWRNSLVRSQKVAYIADILSRYTNTLSLFDFFVNVILNVIGELLQMRNVFRTHFLKSLCKCITNFIVPVKFLEHLVSISKRNFSNKSKPVTQFCAETSRALTV